MKWTARLMALLFAASLLLQPSLASLPQHDRVERTLTIYVPAVSDDKGELIKVEVKIVYPGHGLVNVKSGGSVGASTVYSVRMAVLAASLFLGVDWSSVDVDVTFATLTGLKGPSASFALALAVYALLSPLTPPGNLTRYVVTGAVSPEGLSSRVGGVQAKCKAAVDEGFVFVAPLSNEADVAGCDEDNVILVTGLLDASSSILGYRVYIPPAPLYYPENYADLMKSEAEKMASYASGNLSEALSADLIDYVTANAIRARIEEALDLADDKPYSAASLAFTALSQTLSAIAEARASREGRGYVESLIAKAEAGLREIQASLPKNATTWPEAELLSVAYTRAADAEASIARARALLDKGDVKGAASEAAYALARLETVKTWGRAAGLLAGMGPLVGPGQLSLLASRLDSFVGTAINYTNAVLRLLEEEGGASYGDARALLSRLYSEARAYLEKDEPLTAIGYYREALGLSSYWLFYASLAIGASPEAVKGYWEELEALANHTLSQAAARGLYSVLASSYIEYAGVLMDRGDPMSAVRILEAAVASAGVTLMLALGAPSYLTSSGSVGGAGSAGGGFPAEAVHIVLTAVAGVSVAFAAGYVLGLSTRLREALQPRGAPAST